MPRRTGSLPAGFTLTELLLAASLGALLLIATAMSAGMFGQQLTEAEAKTHNGLHAALSTVTDDLRYAWWADVPGPRMLTICDPSGNKTLYQFSTDRLVVTRPDGSTGTIIDNLKSASFSADTVTRFREAAPVSRAATFWSASAPVGVVQAAVLDVGQSLALGFTPTSPAPVGGNPTPGVQEQMTDATPDTLSLPIGAVTPLTGGAKLTIALYRARAPNDARPEGAALASTVVNVNALPSLVTNVLNSKTGKVINVPKGAAWGWWKKQANAVLTVTPPAATLNIDVSSFKAKVTPGNCYTLTLTPSGSGVALASYATASASKSGVALDTGAGYTVQALAVARSLAGTVTLTRSTATATASRVLVTLVDLDGNQSSGSAAVIGQSLTEDAWLGVLPGETGP